MADKPTTMEQFYSDLQTVPKLISDLALSVAEAQGRLDQAYMEELAEFFRLASSLKPAAGQEGPGPDQMIALFRAMAPSRYQFTETVVEVRADLQMARQDEFKIDGTLTVKGAAFAVAVNAAYSRRTASDASASALIRTVLNAVPADPGMLDKLLPRAGQPQTAVQPQTARFKEFAEAFKALMPLLPKPAAETDTAKTTPAAPGPAPAPKTPGT